MATMFTVAPSNRSNTEVQNKRKEIPIVSKQEQLAAMVFQRTRKNNKKKEKENLEKGKECGGEITYAHMHRRICILSCECLRTISVGRWFMLHQSFH